MTSAEIMEFAKASPFDWEYPMKKENQKLYPFYFLTNFYCNVQDVNDANNYIKVPDLFCDYCGENVTEGGNGSYFTAFVVIDGSGELKNICRPNRCPNKPDNLMDFQDQKYGIREPLCFPEMFKDSKAHQIVFSKLCSNWKGYYLKSKLNGITLEDFHDKFHTIMEGSNYCFPGFNGYCERVTSELKLMDNDHKIVLKLSNSQIVKIINEIILAQREEQLVLW